MKEQRKRAFIVTCRVNMDANREERVRVATTKPRLAMQKAEAELISRGFLYARAIRLEQA